MPATPSSKLWRSYSASSFLGGFLDLSQGAVGRSLVKVRHGDSNHRRRLWTDLQSLLASLILDLRTAARGTVWSSKLGVEGQAVLRQGLVPQFKSVDTPWSAVDSHVSPCSQSTFPEWIRHCCPNWNIRSLPPHYQRTLNWLLSLWGSPWRDMKE